LSADEPPDHLWQSLSPPWQACLALVWEAYCDDCTPIAAVVTDAAGNILSTGRNRIRPRHKMDGHGRGWEIAHAETEALHNLDYAGLDPHPCILYTTTEPCPMCIGTFYMSGLRTLYYAARDPYAGSVDLLGTTWYMSRKPVTVHGPDPRLEPILTALFAEQEIHRHDERLPEDHLWQKYRKTIPEGVTLGLQLARSRTLVDLRDRQRDAREMLNEISSRNSNEQIGKEQQ